MSDRLNHPDTERLQAYVETSLDAGDSAAVESHLVGCLRCRSEVDEYRELFAMLSGLPLLRPSGAFAERVMARVRVSVPWHVRVQEWVEKLLPRTTRGWAVATAILALPVMAGAGLTWWLVSRPGVTPQALWTFLTGLAGSALSSGWQWAWARFAGSSLATWAAAGMELVESAGRGEIGLVLVMFATATAASIWILYQNLFRTEARSSDYASYVF